MIYVYHPNQSTFECEDEKSKSKYFECSLLHFQSSGHGYMVHILERCKLKQQNKNKKVLNE